MNPSTPRNRAISAVMTVVLALGLMPLPAYAAPTSENLGGGGTSEPSLVAALSQDLTTQPQELSAQSLQTQSQTTEDNALDVALTTQDAGDTFANEQSREGDGSETAPFKLSTYSDLLAFKAAINADKHASTASNDAAVYNDKYFELAADIKIPAEADTWTTSIGTGGSSTAGYYFFAGHFDGKGHTISGVTIETTAVGSDATYGGGLFGYVKASKNNVSIKNVKVVGSVKAYLGNGSSGVGGLIGYVTTNTGYSVSIENCIADVNVEAYRNSGGLLGQGGARVTVKNCLAMGNVTAKDITTSASANDAPGMLGGLVGGWTSATSASLSNSLYTGQVKDESTYYEKQTGNNSATLNALVGKIANNLTPTNCFFVSQDYEKAGAYSVSASKTSTTPEGSCVALSTKSNLSTVKESLNTNNVDGWQADDTAIAPSGFTSATKGYSISSGGDEKVAHDIEVSDAIAHGTIEVSATSAKEKASVVVTPHPDKKYRIASVSVSTANGSITASPRSDGSYVFEMPDEKVTVSATFELYDALSANTILVKQVASAADIVDGAQYVFVDKDGAFAMGESDEAIVATSITAKNNETGTLSFADSATASQVKWVASGAGTSVVFKSPEDKCLVVGNGSVSLASNSGTTLAFKTAATASGLVTTTTLSGLSFYAALGYNSDAFKGVTSSGSPVADCALVYRVIETPVKYTLTFLNDDESAIGTLECVENTEAGKIDAPTATKEADAQYAYEFNGWNPELAAVTADATYMATYSEIKKQYTPTIAQDIENGEVELSSTNAIDWGTEVTITTTPETGYELDTLTVKDADGNDVAVTEGKFTMPASNVTISATFKLKTYTITWKNGDETLTTTQVQHGTVPTYSGSAPTKAGTAELSYEHSGWKPTPVAATENATYTATFSQVKNKYAITFVDADGTTVLKAAEYEYGTPAASIEQPETPTKDADAQYTYTFDGWDPALADVTATATYTAKYKAEPKPVEPVDKPEDAGVKAEGGVFADDTPGVTYELAVTDFMQEAEESYSESVAELVNAAVEYAEEAGVEIIATEESVAGVFQVELTKYVAGTAEGEPMAEGVGALKLTFPVADVKAGDSVRVIQLHESETAGGDPTVEPIEYTGSQVTVADGSVSITLNDKLSTFIVTIALSKANLEAAIASALNDLDNTAVADSAADVAKGAKFVTQADADTLSRAIDAAKSARDTATTQDALDEAAAAMLAATADFDAAKKDGAKEAAQESGDGKTDEPAAPAEPAVETQAMHRLYNPNSGEHFYTADVAERDNLVKEGWNYEDVAWTAPAKSGTPVYRLYNGNEPLGDHHYTTDRAEYDYLVSVGWTGENIGWYSDDAKGVALHRLYNPNAYPSGLTGAHHYTASDSERDFLVSVGWRYEDHGWYGVKE